MTCAIIDIGSNTVRLSSYQIEGHLIRRLFHKKSTAGLASYIVDGVMSEEGIFRVCKVLQDFGSLLECISMDKVSVFATASLRNISNSEEAAAAISEKSGFSIEVLSGTEEATLGYYGIEGSAWTKKGILLDIGGGSTEITSFSKLGPDVCRSYPIGALNLYASFVSGILPTEKEYKAMRSHIQETVSSVEACTFSPAKTLVAIGGSARAALSLAEPAGKVEESLPVGFLYPKQLKELIRKIMTEEKFSSRVLRSCPDRIHTIVPGLTILYTLSKTFGVETIEVCSESVREGYLKKRILQAESPVSIL